MRSGQKWAVNHRTGPSFDEAWATRRRIAAGLRKAQPIFTVVPRLDNDRVLELDPPSITLGKLICYSKMTERERVELRDKYEMLYEFIGRQLILIDDALTKKASAPAS